MMRFVQNHSSKPTRSEFSDSVRRSLSESNFPWYDSANDSFRITPLEATAENQNQTGFFKGIGDFFQPIFEYINGLYDWISFPYSQISTVSDYVRWLIWSIILLAILVMVVLIIIALVDTSRTPGQSKPNSKTPDLIPDLEIDILGSDLPYLQIWQMAVQQKTQGLHQRAVALAWSAIIKKYLAAHDVSYQRSLTPRQWSKLIDRTHPELKFSRLLRLYERVTFADRKPSLSSLEIWWDTAVSIFESQKISEVR